MHMGTCKDCRYHILVDDDVYCVNTTTITLVGDSAEKAAGKVLCDLWDTEGCEFGEPLTQ